MPDDLLSYVDQTVENRRALIEQLLQQWRKKREDEALALYENCVNLCTSAED
ncbi:MAG: hypothetical protein HC908_16200 [Calothrix sp. SM1_7_51]|nr:hypothetical protein [Calothrix sp. SM1_7_51]